MPPRRSARAPSVSAPPSKPTRSARTSRKQVILSPSPSEDSVPDEEDDVSKDIANGGKMATRTAAKRDQTVAGALKRRKAKTSVETQESVPDREEAEEAPIAQRRGRKVVVPAEPRPSTKSRKETVDSSDVDDQDAGQPSQRKRSSTNDSSSSHLPTPPTDPEEPSSAHPIILPDLIVPDRVDEDVGDGQNADDAEDADETVRLAQPLTLEAALPATPSQTLPRSSPLPPATASPTAPPSGPKPRLTIHKLVLVDFKSEIVDLPGVDNFLLVPKSQLVITRTAFLNNSSKYSINDRTSSFTEVTSLLKGKGIDLDHNRFLILQGEVESIAQMKAKAQNEHEDGLLEYLEDIIGTTRYKEPIEQASREVETLNEERGERMNRLRVVEREKAALEDKKHEAEDFLRDSNELTRKKSLLWQFHMYTLQNNIEITTKAIELLTAELAEEQELNAGHLAEIADLQTGYDEKLAAFEASHLICKLNIDLTRVEQEVKRLTDALVKDSKKFEKEEVGLQEKKKHLTTKQKKFKKSITDDGHARSEALAAIDNHGSELETTRAKVANLEEKLINEEAELEEIRDSLKDKTDVFTTKIEAKQRELEPWTAKISEKQSAIDIATSERDLLAQKATGAQATLQEAEANLTALKEGDCLKQEELGVLKKEAVRVKRQIAESEGKVESMAAKSDELRTKFSTFRHKTDEAKASLAADKSENAVLSSLNKLKAQGRIKGFHGRLGDLGVIEDKYDVAVTTACSALNNLIVDTVEQGQACIEHLRKGNVGRASFMVLEKLPPRDLDPIETPENVPRLFDLIKVKEARFAPAFYKGLFNTLVADDLTQAQRIGYGKKRWRVVTLAGQLIDPSGTMSGGGAKVSKGGMSSKLSADKVAPEVVERYEKDMTLAEEELVAYQMERKAAETEMALLQKRLPEVEIALEKIGLDVSTASKRIIEAQKRLDELQLQSKPDAADEKRIKILDGEIISTSKETEKLREKSSMISDQIKELQNKILEVGGVKLRAIQSKVATTKGLVDLANESITKIEVGLAKAERDVEKLEKALVTNKANMEGVNAELQVVDGDLGACSADLAVIKEKVQEVMDASAEIQEALATSKAELDEKSMDINAFRALEVDIKQKIEDNGRIQTDSKDKFKHWSRRHEELELVYVDEEEEEEEGTVEGEKAPLPPAADVDSEILEQQPRKKGKTESFELVEYSPDELRSVDREMLNAEITQLEEETGKAKPNLNVLTEYRKRESEFLDRAQDMENVTSSRDIAKKRYDDLRKVRLDEFMAGFSAISSKLKEMYQMITMGGNAEIELIDSMDPFSEVLSIMPPKKSWRAIANLSGGEKTLASLALVFALHVFKPTPLYFMDEIDAALDFKNVSIVANYIQSKTQAAQFIVISLRNDMFELAHRLVGIYKTSNCTKSIAIDNKDLRTQAVVPRPRKPLASPDTQRQVQGQQISPMKQRPRPSQAVTA
ncbi:MAG: hypothetical protein TREMPRED_002256 [Tremellales sp. Tagirdzhanova-0007]|nr:MAG: hypothetical protein TREMPRED_002256 [Tremellales sp. Tagirdzhanova-0007]